MLETLGHYRLLEPLGSDRLGEAFRARDTLHGRTVAVRVVGPHIASDAAKRTHLVSAARAASALSHPSIAALYEVAEDGDLLFVACEYVAGERLQQVIAGGALHPRRAIACAAQVADALAEAHAHGIVHGALGPDKIVLTPKGTAKLLDVGLAPWTAERECSSVSDDLRSLGVTLVEMMTGRTPAAGPPGSVAALRRIALPSGFERIITGLIETGQTSYESAAVLAADLREVAATLDAKNAAQSPPDTQTVSEHRSPSLWLLLALVIGLAAAFAGWAIWGR